MPEAVRRFFDSTEKAERAFDALAARVQVLQEELNETNEKLHAKVSELDRLSSHLVSLLDSLNDGVVAVDNAGVICLFNPAAEKLTTRGFLGTTWPAHLDMAR